VTVAKEKAAPDIRRYTHNSFSSSERILKIG